MQLPTALRCVARIYHLCDDYRRRLDGVVDAAIDVSDDFINRVAHHLRTDFDPKLTDIKTGQGYLSSTPSLFISAKLVSLPSQAGTADLLAVLPPHLASLYSDPTNLLLPPSDVPPIKPLRVASLVSKKQYRLLIQRLSSLGMVDFTTQPKALNGLFAVAKDGGSSQRLIIDARPANSLFIPSPHIELPTPEIITHFDVPNGQTLFAAKADLDNFYHRLRLPIDWRPYFALPAIEAGDLNLPNYAPSTLVYPCCTTLPMGFSHSVFLAQAAHEHLVDTRVPLLRRADRLIRQPLWVDSKEPFVPPSIVASTLPPPSGDFSIDRLRYTIYIDDLNVYGTNEREINEALDQYTEALKAANLPPKPSKIVRATSGPIECLGVTVCGDTGLIGVAATKLESLRRATLRLLEEDACTGHQLAHLVGRWTWAMLVRRPSLACFSAVYRFIECAQGSRFNIWPSVRTELRAIVYLAPLLIASLKDVWSHNVIATDASMIAEGVVYSEPPLMDIAATYKAPPSQPGHPAPPALVKMVTDNRWKNAVHHRWRQQQPIAVLELRAVLAAARWSSRTKPYIDATPSIGVHTLLLTDSASVYGAIIKGRTSAHSLLRPMRALAALLLAMGMWLRLQWLPSELNPADRLSRS